MSELIASVNASKSSVSSAGDVPFCYYKALVADKPSMRHLLSILRLIWVSGQWCAGRRPRLSRVEILPDWHCLSWSEQMEIAKQHNLRIAFLQDNPKRFGSASRVRYEQYKSV